MLGARITACVDGERTGKKSKGDEIEDIFDPGLSSEEDSCRLSENPLIPTTGRDWSSGSLDLSIYVMLTLIILRRCVLYAGGGYRRLEMRSRSARSVLELYIQLEE